MTGEETSESRKFAIIGVAGYIAPRHLNAMRSLGCDLVAAHDVFDSVGKMIDGYFPRAYFTTDPDDFREAHVVADRRGVSDRLHPELPPDCHPCRNGLGGGNST